MQKTSVGVTIYRSILVAGISIGGSVLQEELKAKLGVSYALIISVMLAALIFAVLENFSMAVIQKVRILRQLFVPESRIEGWWVDLVLNKQTGYPEYGGVIYISYDEGSLRISGTTYGTDGRSHGTFRSSLAIFDNDILDFSYQFTPKSGSITEDPGFARYTFQKSDGKPDSFSGFFLDSFNVMSMTIDAQRVNSKQDILRCNDAQQRHAVFLDFVKKQRMKPVSVQDQGFSLAAASEFEAFKSAMLSFARGEYEKTRDILMQIEPKRSLYEYAAEYISMIVDNPTRRIPQPFDVARAFEVFNTYEPERQLKRQIAAMLSDDIKNRAAKLRLGCVGPGDGILLRDTLMMLPNAAGIEIDLFEPNLDFAQKSKNTLTDVKLNLRNVHGIPIESVDVNAVFLSDKLDLVHCVFSLMCLHPRVRAEALQKLRAISKSVVVVEFDDSTAEKQGLDPDRIAQVQQRFISLVQAIVDGSGSQQHPFDKLGIVSFLMPVMFGYFAGDDRSTYEQSSKKWQSDLSSAGFTVRSIVPVAFPKYLSAFVMLAD